MSMAADRFASPAPDVPRTSAGDGMSTHAKLGAQFNALFHSFKRLTSLQLSIWMKQVKSLVARIVLVAIFSVVALFLVLMGVIFLYAGVYHVLTDILHVPTVWALLIFAGAHLLAAGVLVTVAISMLHKKDKDKPEKSEKHT